MDVDQQQPDPEQKSWGYGYGNISLEPNGRYRARLWIKALKKYKPVGTFDTLEEAQQELASHHAALQRGPVATGINIIEYGNLRILRWKAAGKDSWKTDEGRLKIIELHAPFALDPLDTINRGQWKDFFDSLYQIESKRGELFGAGTIKHVRNLANAIYKDAVDNEICTINPVLTIPAPKGFTNDNWTALSVDEITQLARCHRDTRLPGDNIIPLWPADEDRLTYAQCVVFLLVIYTGLRQGECAALLWDDVVDLDGESPYLWVCKSWHKPYTKTRKARKAYLIPAATELLKGWREYSRGERGGLPKYVWSKRYVYGYDWNWAQKVELTRGVCTLGARQLAGIMRRVTFHHLRDTCASHLLTGTWGFKWTIAEVAELLGHTTTYVTERYARILPGALAEVAKQTFRRVSVAKSSSESQLPEITGRAMQGSNLRHPAPEADANIMISNACEADGKSTETLAAALMREAMALAMQQLQAQAQAQQTPPSPLAPVRDIAVARRKKGAR